ncbi:hypothetical protein BGX21_004890 [Mortierella sp. AD011]|nr:hypothetical protein BGX20_005047 [Mortierella sp. AD010]KAF9400151.1 hypothetical protein BGX21_004890 [Mortierella sp. AD011]
MDVMAAGAKRMAIVDFGHKDGSEGLVIILYHRYRLPTVRGIALNASRIGLATTVILLIGFVLCQQVRLRQDGWKAREHILGNCDTFEAKYRVVHWEVDVPDGSNAVFIANSHRGEFLVV